MLRKFPVRRLRAYECTGTMSRGRGITNKPPPVVVDAVAAAAGLFPTSAVSDGDALPLPPLLLRLTLWPAALGECDAESTRTAVDAIVWYLPRSGSQTLSARLRMRRDGSRPAVYVAAGIVDAVALNGECGGGTGELVVSQLLVVLVFLV